MYRIYIQVHPPEDNSLTYPVEVILESKTKSHSEAFSHALKYKDMVMKGQKLKNINIYER